MKTFKEISAQMERIYTLYLHGYGSHSIIERAERFAFSRVQNVGLLF